MNINDIATQADLAPLHEMFSELYQRLEALEKKVEKPIRVVDWLKSKGNPYTAKHISSLAAKGKFPAEQKAVNSTWYCRESEADAWLERKGKKRR